MNRLKNFIVNSKLRSILLFLFSVISTASLVTYNPDDPSFNVVTDNGPSNFLLYFGSYLSDLLYQLCGQGIFILPLCTFSWSYFLFRKKGKEKIRRSLPCVLSMLLSICFFSSTSAPFETKTFPTENGGILGIIIWYFTNLFVPASLYKVPINVIFFSLFIIFLVLALAIPLCVYNKIIFAFFNGTMQIISKTRIIRKKAPKHPLIDTGKAYYAKGELNPIDKINKKNTTFFSNINTSPKRNKAICPANSKAQDIINKSFSEDILPSVEFLKDTDIQNVKPQTKNELNEKAKRLLSVLKDFGIKGKIMDIKEGPVVTVYEFEPGIGTKSSRVIGLAGDIARSVSAISIHIAVIPGRNVLGIEIVNRKRMFFRLKELIQTAEFKNSNISLPLILGKDLGGNPVVADLAKMPHLLVGGTTGSGKSVAINAMIMSLLYKYTPDECKMIMIDPKMLELLAYDNIPHLMTPVVTEPGKAVTALKWAVKEMENRYKLMSYLGVRNIANYNIKIQEAIKNEKVLERKIQTGFDPETGNPTHDTVPIDMKKMPFIVVIVDEMADLMLVVGKDIESSIQRLAQMARAAGIHIIMATQRPSVDVITGVIKVNFPSRISFKVTSKIDSRTILGEQGSEQLLGLGDMLYMSNSSRILRVHGVFVDDKEVERVTNHLRGTGMPEYVSAVMKSKKIEKGKSESKGVKNDINT